MSRQPWYAAGLRFDCSRCGACCSGAPGYVWIGSGEAAAAAAHLGLGIREFLARYARRVPGGVSLREDASGRCLLFDDGCRIYPVRPAQCRTYPFWARIVADRSSWEREAASCPGIGAGPLHGRERIRAAAARGLKPRGTCR